MSRKKKNNNLIKPTVNSFKMHRTMPRVCIAIPFFDKFLFFQTSHVSLCFAVARIFFPYKKTVTFFLPSPSSSKGLVSHRIYYFTFPRAPGSRNYGKTVRSLHRTAYVTPFARHNAASGYASATLFFLHKKPILQLYTLYSRMYCYYYTIFLCRI